MCVSESHRNSPDGSPGAMTGHRVSEHKASIVSLVFTKPFQVWLVGGCRFTPCKHPSLRLCRETQ